MTTDARGVRHRLGLTSLASPRAPDETFLHPFLGSLLWQVLSVLLVGVVSGFALKQQQLQAVAAPLAAIYPLAAKLPFVFVRIAEVGFWFCLNAALVGAVLGLDFGRASARLGETFGVLALGYAFGPLTRFWLVPLLAIAVNARALLGRSDRLEAQAWLRRQRVALACSAAIVAIYAVFFAPLLDPLISIDQIDRFKAIIPFSLGNTMRATLPAIAGLQEPAWHPQLTLGGGSLRPELMGHQNYLLSAIFALFPISAADVVRVFQLEKLAVFLLYCMGGVGYFFFCHRGLGLRAGTSFIVGIVAVMSDGLLARHFEVDWGYASCAVPLVLLAVKRARDLDSPWLYAVAGGVAGVVQSLHFTHPEVILAVMYFVVAWIAWDYALTVPRELPRRERWRRLAGIPIFCAACVLANTRFVGGILEFAYDGNQITSERLHDYGAHGLDVIALQLLGPLGLSDKGSGPFREPYVPYFYGLTAAFLVLLGAVRLLRRPSSRPTMDTWSSFALVAPVLLAVVGLFRSSVVGALYGFGLPGVPFHTGVRILHPVHACLMILFGQGLEELRRSSDGDAGALGRGFVLKALAAFLALALMAGPWWGGEVALHHVEALFAIVTVAVVCCVPLPPARRLVVLAVLVPITAIVAMRDTTMVTGVGYHQNVLARARGDRKSATDSVAARLLHPERFSPSVYPLSLAARLQPAREDLANPRTRLFVWSFVRDFERDLRRLLAFHEAAGGGGTAPTEAEARAALVALEGWRAEVGSPAGVDVRHLDALLALETPHDHLYYHDQTGGLKEVDRVMASIPPNVRYPRIAFSNDFKAKAGGDALNDFPTFASSHYYVMGAANLRWPSSLDYFFPDINRVMSEPIYYEANMFPPISRDALDVLGFDYVMATDAELPAWQAGTEVVARTPTGTLLHNKDAFPLATLFRRAKVIPALRYDELSFNSMERVQRGRAELAAVDLKSELLVEALSPLRFENAPAGTHATGEGVEVVRASGNFAVFQVHNPGPEALLFYSDAYHPHWRAYVDRARTAVLRADLGFKAVVVPSGDHLVWMEFVPVRAELIRAMTILLGMIVVIQAARAVERRRRAAPLGEARS
jgi:hypothetical protein